MKAPSGQRGSAAAHLACAEYLGLAWEACDIRAADELRLRTTLRIWCGEGCRSEGWPQISLFVGGPTVQDAS